MPVGGASRGSSHYTRPTLRDVARITTTCSRSGGTSFAPAHQATGMVLSNPDICPTCHTGTTPRPLPSHHRPGRNPTSPPTALPTAPPTAPPLKSLPQASDLLSTLPTVQHKALPIAPPTALPRESHPQALAAIGDTGTSRGVGAYEGSGGGNYGGRGRGVGGGRDDDASAGVVQGSIRGGGAHFTAARGRVPGSWQWRRWG